MEYEKIKVEQSKMSTRGQIVIPKGVRERMKLKKDTLFMVGSIDNDTIILKKVDKEKMVREFMNIRTGILRRSKGLSDEDIEREVYETRKKD